MKILGIDPGTAATGYGVLEIDSSRGGKNKNKYKCLQFGCIKTEPIDRFSKRLLILSREIRKIIKAHKPNLAAIETLFFFKNQKTIISVSRATGVIILMMEKMKIPIVEYSPPQVKKFLTKDGRAEKKEIQKKVIKILKIKKKSIKDDAADALAIAIYAAEHL
ncbi:MAG: crossover junction endodeoxyribonuclease RuvC [Patescibacteria group bacterium]